MPAGQASLGSFLPGLWGLTQTVCLARAPWFSACSSQGLGMAQASAHPLPFSLPFTHSVPHTLSFVKRTSVRVSEPDFSSWNRRSYSHSSWASSSLPNLITLNPQLLTLPLTSNPQPPPLTLNAYRPQGTGLLFLCLVFRAT